MSKNSGANGGRSSSPPSQRSLAMQYQPGRRPPSGHRSVNSVLVQDEPRSSDRHPRSGSAAEELKKGLRKLGLALLDRAVAVVSDKVDDVARALEDMATRGGPKASALLGGLRAKLGGRNVVWGAIRAGVTAMTPGAKVALVLGLVLAIVVLPVTLLVLLIALVVLLIVWSMRRQPHD